MGKLAICFDLTPEKLRKAESAGAVKLIFVKKPFSLQSEKIQLINARDLDRPSYEVTFRRNKTKLQEWKQLAPSFFSYDGLDLLEAINKDLFWSNRYEGMLQFSLQQHLQQGEKVLDLGSRPAGKNVFLKWLWLQGRRWNALSVRTEINIPIHDQRKKAQYAFFVKDAFEYAYSEVIANELGREKCLFIANHALDIEAGFRSSGKPDLEIQGYPFRKIGITGNELNSGLKIFGPEELFNLFRIRESLVNAIEVNKNWFKSEIKIFFTLAQENTGFGNITALMGKRDGKLIVNTHNGLKAPDIFNSDNHFGIWFCWDERMRSMLYKDCHIPEEQLVVAGHVMRDVAMKHKDAGTFRDFDSGGRTISLFSVWENAAMKWEVARVLLDAVNRDPDLRLIIRLHPLENKAEWGELVKDSNPRQVRFVFPKPDSDKTALYDQLNRSDVAVLFGSTVALECTWFGVPVVTAEYREKSMLYLVDDKSVYHERSAVGVLNRINKILQAPKTGPVRESQEISVAAEMKRILLQKISLR